MGGVTGRLVVGLVGAAMLATMVAPAPGVSAEEPDPPPSTEGRLPGGTSLSVGFGADPEDGALRLDGLASLGEGEAVGGTTMIYVLDVSGSVRNHGGCGAGDQNNDGRSDDILDCQIAAARALNDAAADAGSVAEVGVAIYGLNGAPADVGPETGIQLLTGPATDANASGLRDVEEVLTSVRVGEVRRFTRRTVGSWTNFQAGIDAACTALSVSTQPNNVVVFMSDGFNNRGSHVSNALPCDPPATFHAFAVGAGSACTSGAAAVGCRTSRT